MSNGRVYRRGIIVNSLLIVWLAGVFGGWAANSAETSPGGSPLKGIHLGEGILDISLQWRLREEVFHNYDKRRYGTGLTDAPLLSRVRLGASYRPVDEVKFFVQLQDSRYWLSNDNIPSYGTTNPFKNPLDLHQAYVRWDHINDTPLGLKIGRQSICYGDNRIWGPGNWGNTGRYLWDAAKILWDGEVTRTDFILAKRVELDKRSFDNGHYDMDVFGIYSHLLFLPQTWDFFYVLKRDSEGTTKGESGIGDLDLHTAGLYWDGHWHERIDYRGTFAYQFGDWGDDRVEAFGLNARVGYTFTPAWKPRLGLEYTYASGDEDPHDGVRNTFSAVVGSVDSKYGRLNLFNWMNLEDYQVSFSLRPDKRLKVLIEAHYFRLADDRDAWYWASGRPMGRDSSGSTDSELGQEVDLLVWYAFRPRIKFMAGYGHFFSGPFVDAASHDGGDTDWGFFQTTFSW